VADFFEKAAKDLGITIAGRDSWDPKAANYQALMQKIKATNPDAVFLGGLICSNGGQLIKDKAAVLGPNTGVKLIAPDGFFLSSTLTGQGSAGAAGEGMYVSNAGVPADKLVGAGKTFIDQFKAKYNVSVVQPYTAYAAQTAQVLLNAIAASDGTRASVTKNVFGMKITNGILGTFQIGPKGDIIGQQQFTIGIGKNGQFATYDVVNPDPALVAKITSGG
jgi:branched-chain amino acid transport system substrate-binding protein